MEFPFRWERRVGKREEGGSGILVKSIVKTELGHFGAEV
jgi:hypothetical protein